jgi:hypothetical protein
LVECGVETGRELRSAIGAVWTPQTAVERGVQERGGMPLAVRV